MQIALLSYLIYLLIFMAINLAIVYHVWKFSYQGDASKLVLTIYSGVILCIIFATFASLKGAL